MREGTWHEPRYIAYCETQLKRQTVRLSLMANYNRRSAASSLTLRNQRAVSKGSLWQTLIVIQSNCACFAKPKSCFNRWFRFRSRGLNGPWLYSPQTPYTSCAFTDFESASGRQLKFTTIFRSWFWLDRDSTVPRHPAPLRIRGVLRITKWNSPWN